MKRKRYVCFFLGILLGLIGSPGLQAGMTPVLAIDGDGNSYVAGSSLLGSSTDFTLVKYNTAGVRQWVRRYDGPDAAGDWLKAIAVGPTGDIYLFGQVRNTGYQGDFGTVKYDPDGHLLWARFYGRPTNDEPQAMAVDEAGNVFVTGSVELDSAKCISTVKYKTDGSRVWVRPYRGVAGRHNEARVLAVDGDGNVYVAGPSRPSSGPYDRLLTLKYDSDGNLLWSRIHAGLIDPQAMAVDGSGNVFITGSIIPSGGYKDFFTIKYAANGDRLWVRTANGASDLGDAAYALAVDGSGNVHVTGYSTGADGYDYLTIKYDPAGTRLWVQRYDGAAGDTDMAYSVALDPDGNVYVTGRSDVAGASGNYLTVKYDPDGSLLWTRQFNGATNGHDFATAVAVRGGALYVTGESDGANSLADYVTIKYDLDGRRRWARRFERQ
ncbi:SBBP repeat-containing protein [Syntrophobacter fumaroxidans]|uniref:Cellulose-binding n=1 Tax=Syntrophobacter fumaroxidans (strain DSM 10017 / MPOB) TaxID=335543 RepID=A0LEM8_SYNFM|nr:SBBP repeat-containing protein [Syntrophobacter fumaroxidans]ABK15880.1 cellulose-binding [Syntrophobacter fumaroxidans MPOB]